MDYPLQLSAQLRQILKSLRKARGLTQAGLAQRLGLAQSRIADIEAHPGAVSVEQLLQVLTVLGAQWLVRDAAGPSAPTPRLPKLLPQAPRPLFPRLIPSPKVNGDRSLIKQAASKQTPEPHDG